MSTGLLIGLAAAVVVLALVVWWVWNLRRARIVTCPETKNHVVVKLDPGKAVAWSANLGQLRLSDCTRWPEKAGCGQECLAEVERGPSDCMVVNVVKKWYADKKCALCGKQFGEVHWYDHRPALMDEERNTVQWADVPVDDLLTYMETHQPVCWDCHVAEAVVQNRPDLVTERTEDPLRKRLYH